MLARSRADRIIDWIITILLLMVGVSTLLPLLNTLAISLSDRAAVSGGMVGLWPVGFNLNAYKMKNSGGRLASRSGAWRWEARSISRWPCSRPFPFRARPAPFPGETFLCGFSSSA